MAFQVQLSPNLQQRLIHDVLEIVKQMLYLEPTNDPQGLVANLGDLLCDQLDLPAPYSLSPESAQRYIIRMMSQCQAYPTVGDFKSALKEITGADNPKVQKDTVLEVAGAWNGGLLSGTPSRSKDVVLDLLVEDLALTEDAAMQVYDHICREALFTLPLEKEELQKHLTDLLDGQAKVASSSELAMYQKSIAAISEQFDALPEMGRQEDVISFWNEGFYPPTINNLLQEITKQGPTLEKFLQSLTENFDEAEARYIRMPLENMEKEFSSAWAAWQQYAKDGTVPVSSGAEMALGRYRTARLMGTIFLREAQKSLEKLAPKLVKPRWDDQTPQNERFTWKGIKFLNQGWTEREVLVVLDNLAWVMDLFKRRGVSKLLALTLSEVQLGDTWSFKNEYTGTSQTAAGNYTWTTKTLRLFKNSLKGSSGKMLRRWIAEVFIHELGHHVHLNVLPKAAKEFWDSGWLYVEEARKKVERLSTVTQKDRERYFQMIEDAGWDPNAVGKRLKPLERLHFIGYLHNRELAGGVKRLRLAPWVKEAMEQLRNPRQYMRDSLLMGDDEIDREYDTVYAEMKKIMRRRFGLKLTGDHDLPKEILEEIRSQDNQIEKALDALGIPTFYGRTNVKEDFAETFVQFMVHPERLSDTARWRMGRTLGMSASLGTSIMRLSRAANMFLDLGMSERYAQDYAAVLEGDMLPMLDLISKHIASKTLPADSLDEAKEFYTESGLQEVFDLWEWTVLDNLEELNANGDAQEPLTLGKQLIETLRSANDVASDFLSEEEEAVVLGKLRDLYKRSSSVGTRFLRSARDFMRRIRSDADTLGALLNPPRQETFNWKGFRIKNQGYTEKEVRVALDHFAWIMARFKKRGLLPFVTESVNQITFSKEEYQFTTERTRQQNRAAGLYDARKKEIILYDSVFSKSQGSLIKRWFAEVFVHELGHHIHMSLLPREARAFWDSGWELVPSGNGTITLTPRMSQKYLQEIQRAGYDVQKVLRSKKGLDKRQFLGYLATLGAISNVRQVKLRGSAESILRSLQDFMRSPEDVYRRQYPWENLDGMDAREVQKRLNDLERSLLERFKDFFTLKQEIYVADEVAQQLQEMIPDRALEDLGIPTEYGKENVLEDFAETFVLFVHAPERLSKTARWRMGRTLGMSKSLGKEIMRLSREASLRTQDKEVIRAFLQKERKEGRILTSDGRVLTKQGLGRERVARWRADHIVIVSSEATNTDMQILRQLEKQAKAQLIAVHYEYERDDREPSLRIESGGDVRGKQYNGWYAAYLPGETKPVGVLEYAAWKERGTWSMEDKVAIQMVTVTPKYRKQGIAQALYARLLKDNNMTLKDLEPTMRTDLGHEFRQNLRLTSLQAKARRLAAQYMEVVACDNCGCSSACACACDGYAGSEACSCASVTASQNDLKVAKNLPPEVERYVKEHKEQGMDEGKAWAIAWSRYCKYTNPGAKHCKSDDYFHGKGKKKANQRTAGPNDARMLGMDPSKFTRTEKREILRERPWLNPKAPSAYQYAMDALKKSVVRWQELVENKGAVFKAYKDLHPDLKVALHEENKKVMGSSAIAWRYEPSGNFPSNMGGMSLHVAIDPASLQRDYILKNMRAYRVSVNDVMIHPDTPNNPLGKGAWKWEREMILKPDAKPQQLSEAQKQSILRKLV